jgi:hypothetical protein
VKLYLYCPIHLHTVVHKLSAEYVFMVWYLVKHMDNFTFHCDVVCGVPYVELVVGEIIL